MEKMELLKKQNQSLKRQMKTLEKNKDAIIWTNEAIIRFKNRVIYDLKDKIEQLENWRHQDQKLINELNEEIEGEENA